MKSYLVMTLFDMASPRYIGIYFHNLNFVIKYNYEKIFGIKESSMLDL